MSEPRNDLTDVTHDRSLTSWVESANVDQTDFPVQNLPLGVFRKRDGGEPEVGVAIGDQILDVASALRERLFEGEAIKAAELASGGSLNRLMAAGRAPAKRLRRAASLLLRADTDEGAKARTFASRILVPMSEAELLLPAKIGDFTDFYASIFHAQRVGRMFRPDNPLLPNYKYVPIAYHGRASTIEVSGTNFPRPAGQRRPQDASPEDAPTFEPSRALDYEAEFGVFIGAGNENGEPIPLDRASEHVFGMGLLNDWSARDIQAWEYQPLGPFLAKSFASTISPWIVTLDALAPFRTAAYRRPDGDPAPLPYLQSDINERSGGVDITMEARERALRIESHALSRALLDHLSNGDPPREQRVPTRSGRPFGNGDGLELGRGRGGQYPRENQTWRRALDSSFGPDSNLHRGR
jgi:fumarylacetoacetase